MKAASTTPAARPASIGKAPLHGAWAVVGAATALVGRALFEIPAIVEWHRSVAYPWFASFVQPLSGSSAGTVGEGIALPAFALAVGVLVRWRFRGGLLIGFAIGILVFGFYISWGLAYRYPPLSARLAPLDAPDAGTAAHLVDLTERASRILAAASEGDVSFGRSDAAAMTRINLGLREGLRGLPASIEASPVRGVAFGPVKLSRVSFALSRLQLSGYYFPWTGEAQINAQMPRTLWPRVAAHEQAHQRGFARENEATVIGLLTCLKSADPSVFYSGTLGLFAGFFRELSRLDAEAMRRIWDGLPPRVIGDFARESDFWKSHEGLAGAVSERVNDTYLKAQGVPSGIDSYHETTLLLLQAIATPGLGIDSLLESGKPPLSPGAGGGVGGKW